MRYVNRDKASRYGFIYIWRDSKHNRFYIGQHWGTIDDGYICSSKWMRDAYRRRPQDFKRRILTTNIQTREETLCKESEWLGLIKEEELGKRYFNFINRRFNHWSVDEKLRKRVAAGNSLKFKGRHNSPGTEIKRGERRSPATEFRKNRTPHNKGKSLEQAVGVERAAEIKKQSSNRRKGKSFSPSTQFIKGTRKGSANPKARAISTPFGEFDTITDSARFLNVTVTCIHRRVKSANQPNWQYI